MSKEAERQYLEIFKRLYLDFPKGQIVTRESPDFTVQSESGCVGMEVTKFYQDTGHGNHSHLKKTESLEEQIAQTTSKRLVASFGFPLFLEVEFKPGAVNERIFGQFVESLFELAAKYLRQLTNRERFDIYVTNHKVLPDGVDSLSLVRTAGLTQVKSSTSSSQLIPNPEPGQIQFILDKKESKVQEYRKVCQDIWLIIVEGYDRSSWFDDFDVARKAIYISSFDRAFLLRAKNDIYLNLNLTREA